MSFLFPLLLPLTASAAEGEGEPATEPGDEVDPTAEGAPAVEGAPADEEPAPSSSGSSMRRRRGTAALVGLESVSDDFGTTLTAPMGGLDLRFGAQLNDLVGLYVPVHLSLGAFQGLGTVAGVPAGLTGTFAATLVADVTLVDRVFAGGGFGYGVLNNPAGPALHLRAGGYPLVSRMEGSQRRRGLAVAADLRLIFADGLTGTYPTLSVGYESF